MNLLNTIIHLATAARLYVQETIRREPHGYDWQRDHPSNHPSAGKGGYDDPLDDSDGLAV